MKKKIVLCMLLGFLLAALPGCSFGDAKETSAKVESKDEDEDEEEDEKKSNRKADRNKDDEDDESDEEKSNSKRKSRKADRDSDEDDEDEKKDEESDSESKSKSRKKKSSAPVLGGDDVEGYEGFEHLYEEILMTDSKENEETGKRERKTITVYMPDDDYVMASGNYAYASCMGIYFHVELDPYLRYDADDYTLAENLEEYVASNYDPFYTTDYKDLDISEVQKLGKNAVKCTVEYCRYDSWDETYNSTFCTYYLTELEGGETVLVSVEINSESVTEKTEELLEELEAFYQFEINWDEERAEEKSSYYEENGRENFYSTGSFMFELPMSWQEDTEASDFETKVYAPGGDADYAGCMITVYEEYLDYDEDMDLYDALDEYSKEDIEEGLGTAVTSYSEEICETNLGEALKLEYRIDSGITSAEGVVYVIIGEYEIFTMQAFQMEDAMDDAFIVMDGILATGQIKEW